MLLIFSGITLSMMGLHAIFIEKVRTGIVIKFKSAPIENINNLNPMNEELRSTTCAFDTAISLQQLVSNLVNSSLPAAKHNNTHLVNEVENGVALGTRIHNAIPIINNLLTAVVANSRNGEIHISAERFRDVVTVEIQERNNYNGYALAYSIGSIEPDAALVGGHISIKGSQQKITTISFCFPDNPIAA